MHAFHRLLVLAFATVFLAPAAANAQPRQTTPQPVPADGTETFRTLLNMARIKPVKQSEFANLNHYEDVIVIALGDCNNVNETRAIQQAIWSGGAVLIASDVHVDLQQFINVNRVQPWVHPQITGNSVECRNPDHVLHAENQWRMNCPFVVPLMANQFGAPNDDPVWRVFGGDGAIPRLTRVATNAPSYVVGSFPDRYPNKLAVFPSDATLPNRFVLPEGAVFAIGGTGFVHVGGEYQFLAMADSWVFTNLMMLDPGTDNLELAARTIEYLQGPNRRKKCIFYENGHLVERFDDLARANRPPIPIPQINPETLQQKIVDLGNAYVDQMQQNDVFNRLLGRGFSLFEILRLLLLLASVYACFYLVRRVFGTRKPVEVPAPNVPGAPEGPPGVFDRRQKELIRRNNVYEPVRDLIREFFATTGIHGEPGPKPQRLQISDVVRKPNSLRQAVKDFWQLAFGPPQVLTVSRWREMEPYFERLQQAYLDGKWEFLFEE